MAQPRVTFIHCLYLAKDKSITSYIGYIARMIERRYDDL